MREGVGCGRKFTFIEVKVLTSHGTMCSHRTCVCRVPLLVASLYCEQGSGVVMGIDVFI